MTPKKILLVDDDRVFTTIIQSLLKSEGYDPVVCNSGNDALKVLKKQKIDLIIMDVLMPGLTGYGFFKMVKSLNNLRKIPLIVMSGHKNMQEFFDAWETEGFLAKPFEPQELLSKIEAIFGTSTKKLEELREKVQQERERSVLARAGGFLNLRRKKVLIIAQDPFLVKKLKTFMESVDIRVSFAIDQHDILREGFIFKPDFVLFEFHDELDQAPNGIPTIWKAWRRQPDLKAIPFVIFFEKNEKGFQPYRSWPGVVSYLESKDLLAGLSQRLIQYFKDKETRAAAKGKDNKDKGKFNRAA